MNESRNRPIPGAGRLGMIVLLLALTMLFGASVVGALVLRLRGGAWSPAAGVPGLPSGLWASTILILASSATIEWAFRSARGGRQQGIRRGLALSFLLGLAFLASQTANWLRWLGTAESRPQLLVFAFFLWTGLHAAHVLGGLIALGIVTRRALRGRYGSLAYDGVAFTRMYWHYLAAVWLVLFALLEVL
ncbi:MAG: heme-copper oxidase subunit III [Candidatus Eisenbacteria bacterium]